MTRNLRIVIITVFILLLVMMTACQSNSIKSNKELLSQNLFNNIHVTPEDGTTKEEALGYITEYIIEENMIKGEFENNIEFEEVTTKELWDVNKIQLFVTKIGYAWYENIVVLKKGKIVKVISSQTIDKIIIGDLDSDGIYDLCVNSSMGSGMVNSYIQVYNVEKDSFYTLNLRKQGKDVILECNEKDNKIDVYYRDMNYVDDTRVYGGQLYIINNELEVVKKHE